MLTTVEKVIFLQEVDVFEHLTTEDLAHIAAISEEILVPPDTVIYKEGGIPDAMYLVLDGKVRLFQNNREVMTAGKSDAFGTWALFDDNPRVVSAESLEESRMLRVNKEEFLEVLSDNMTILQGVFKALIAKVRGLMSRVTGS